MKTIDLTKESAAAAPPGLHYEMLYGSEGLKTRALWEQVFTEDTAEFLHYYFKEKITDAYIHVLKDENGRIVSMVHENPYDVMIHGARRKAYYIVGVATAEPYRHQGCMAFLLQKAVLFAKSKGCPFVFLMPADAAIYEPFGFRYGGRLLMWERSAQLKERMAGNLPVDIVAKSDTAAEANAAAADTASAGFLLSVYSEADAGALAAYAEKTLAERFDTYCVHDEAYFARLNRELASENGAVYLLWRRGKRPAGEQTPTGKQRIAGEQPSAGEQPPAGGYAEAGEHAADTLCGYFCYACETEEYLQEVIVDRDAEFLFCKKEKEKRIMFLSLEEACAYGRTYFPEIV